MRLGQSERETVTASSLSSRPSREERAVCPNKSSVSKPNWTSSQQYLYFTSNTVESSSSSSSSFRGAISTRSAGVVIMSYFLVFLILLPDLKHKDGEGRITFIQHSLKKLNLSPTDTTHRQVTASDLPRHEGCGASLCPLLLPFQGPNLCLSAYRTVSCQVQSRSTSVF